MNSLRKIAAGALAAAMLMSVAACGSANAAGGDNAGQASDANEEWAAATSVADFGSFEDLEVAARKRGALNVIALPHDWSNWGEVIETFKEKYPEIEVTELNPNASSKEEIDAARPTPAPTPPRMCSTPVWLWPPPTPITSHPTRCRPGTRFRMSSRIRTACTTATIPALCPLAGTRTSTVRSNRLTTCSNRSSLALWL